MSEKYESYTLEIPCEPFERTMFDVNEYAVVPSRCTGYFVRVFKGNAPPMAVKLMDDLSVIVAMKAEPVKAA